MIRLEFFGDESKRLDVFIAEEFAMNALIKKEISRSKAKKLINCSRVFLNGHPGKASAMLNYGDIVEVCPFETPKPPEAQDIPLNVLYEDEDIAVIDKLAGMIVHPGDKGEENTIVNAAKFRFESLAKGEGELRPGILHRLDRDTSGLLVMALNDEAYTNIKKQILDRSFKRFYYAIIEGHMSEDDGEINLPIARGKKNRTIMTVRDDGRPALTKYKVIASYYSYSILECELYTGRTHQIRVHFSALNRPIVGDKLYGSKKNEFGVKYNMLHAYKIGFTHPRTCEYLEFRSKPSEEFLAALSSISQKYGDGDLPSLGHNWCNSQ